MNGSLIEPKRYCAKQIIITMTEKEKAAKRWQTEILGISRTSESQGHA